jgi:AcrR family transcriptional regulator
MGDIARAAQVARATVYNNFDDKQDILAAIIAEYIGGYQEIVQRLRETARSGQTSFELIQEMVRAIFSWRVQNADLRPVVAVARNLRGSGWEQANKSADDALVSWIMQVHAADEDEGLIRKEVDLEFGVRATYVMIEAMLVDFDLDTATEEKVKEAADQLALLHWYAICSVPPKEAPQSPLGRKSSG